MRRAARIALAILAAGTAVTAWSVWSYSGRAPGPITRPFDAIVRLLTGRDPATRCFVLDQIGETRVDRFVGTRECYDLDPPRIFSGVFFDEFEGQKFAEGQVPADRYFVDHRIWLNIEEGSDISVAPQIGETHQGSRIWQVRFVGRKTSRPGRYGHMGASEAEIVVDKLLSARLLQRFDGYIPNDVMHVARQLR